MSFVSYAQNFEDVMLWRALKHVDRGFYIDIGAQDPIVDSVSFAFYEHGWRGVHIEPTQQYSNKLRNARPDEYIEQVAVGNFQEELTFYEFADTGLSTADSDVAKRHQDAGYVAIRTEVAVFPLDFILSKYGTKDIHWLKIDVEGLEKSVLESWRVSTVRPWILIIESTKPLTQDESYSDWEDLVISKGYHFAYFDGLNRFYVYQDHHELLRSFAVPPNIFDGFVLSGCASQPFYQLVARKAQQAEAKARQAEAKAQQAEAKAQQAEAKAQQAEAKAQQAEVASAQALMQLQAVYTSTSWRITAPLRALAGQAFKLSPQRLKPRITLLLRHAALYVYRRPRPRNAALAVLNRLPTLKPRLVSLITSTPMPTTVQRNIPAELAQLTPRARQIYADLKHAIEEQKARN